VAVAGILALAFVTVLTVATKSTNRATAAAKDRMALSSAGQADLPADRPAAIPGREPLKPSCESRVTHGTRVEFVCTPAEAARQARDKDKLVFLLHVSGNFEDPGLT
jgi:hypothetical protein